MVDGLDVTGLSDVALVVAMTRGRRDALAEVYRRYGATVYGLAWRLCGDGRAEEVAQQGFWRCGRSRTGTIRTEAR